MLACAAIADWVTAATAGAPVLSEPVLWAVQLFN
jgi:hypothetical protein